VGGHTRSELNFPQLTVVRSEHNGVHIVQLSGELDLRAAGELESTLADCGGDGRVVLDLVELQFIDSTGLATVIRAHQALEAGGGALALVCRDEGSVHRTLETTGLMRLLSVSPDRAAALQALG
jgi:anti-sigma B factor antagonist